MDMEASTFVIKVKHGDFLRRFHESVVDDKLDLSMAKLREKICILFNFATDTELTLTYIDEDGETVTLVDDDDLQDVAKQGLNPLRITVTLNAEKNSSPFICSTESSTPLSSPRVQQPFQNLDSGVSEGNMLSNAISVELQVPAAGLAVNQELDVSVDFVSPHLPGRYDSHWRIGAPSPSGQKFGQHVWVQIQVDATIGGTQHGVHNVLTGPKINNAVMDPLSEDSHPGEALDPITPLPNIEQCMKFPMAESSVVESGATNFSPTSPAPSSTFRPVVDQSDMASSEYPPPPYEHYPSPPSPVIFPSTSPLPYTLPAPRVFYPLPTPPPPSLLYPLAPHVFYPTPPSSMIFHPHPASFYTSSPPFLYFWPPTAGNTQENTEELEGMEEMEEELLMELEGMGFKDVDLNREILRFHEYDLELTVDYLFETYCWDHANEELQEIR